MSHTDIVKIINLTLLTNFCILRNIEGEFQENPDYPPYLYKRVLSTDVALDISTSSTGVYLVGETYGSFPCRIISGGHDYFIRKYDFNGNEIWTWQRLPLFAVALLLCNSGYHYFESPAKLPITLIRDWPVGKTILERTRHPNCGLGVLRDLFIIADMWRKNMVVLRENWSGKV